MISCLHQGKDSTPNPLFLLSTVLLHSHTEMFIQMFSKSGLWKLKGALFMERPKSIHSDTPIVVLIEKMG